MADVQQIGPENELYIKGEVLYTIFENEKEHFSIANIKIHATNAEYDEKQIVNKGHFIHLQKETVYRYYGELKRHTKFVIQFQVQSYQTYLPDTKNVLIYYQCSDFY